MTLSISEEPFIENLKEYPRDIVMGLLYLVE